MNFDFSDEQVMLRKTVRGFVDKEIMPFIGEWDAQGHFDTHTSKKTFIIRTYGSLHSHRIWRQRNGLQFPCHCM